MLLLGKLRRFEAKIKAQTATVLQLKLAGLLWIAMADAAEIAPRRKNWRIRRLNYLDKAEERLRQAREQLLADSLIGINIDCDIAMVYARRCNNATSLAAADDILQTAREALQQLLDTTQQGHDVIRHQLAICYDFLSRLHPNNGYDDVAHVTFVNENREGSTDAQCAYRSFLLAKALRSSGYMQWDYAETALLSAQVCHHFAQALRARVIMWFGMRGEQTLRKLRHPLA